MADQNIPTEEQQNELLFMQLVMMFQGMALQNSGQSDEPCDQPDRAQSGTGEKHD